MSKPILNSYKKTSSPNIDEVTSMLKAKREEIKKKIIKRKYKRQKSSLHRKRLEL